MILPVIAPAIGAIDGVNRDYQTPSPYVSGSLVVFLNGLSRTRDLKDDGWVETGADTFRMDEAPQTGDHVEAYYLTP